jgi:triosephosphate isomerase
MVAEFGCTYAIVGHSERRTLYKENDATVAAKAAAAMAAGLTPLVCVGETLGEREAGSTEAVVSRQLDAVLVRLGERVAEAVLAYEPVWRQLEAVLVRLGERVAEAVLAYEPVWAIGTGRNATPEQAQEVHSLLRRRLGAVGSEVTLLYGGSVKPSNAKGLFQMPDIDGGLIGGASLKADEFLAIAIA